MKSTWCTLYSSKAFQQYHEHGKSHCGWEISTWQTKQNKQNHLHRKIVTNQALGFVIRLSKFALVSLGNPFWWRWVTLILQKPMLISSQAHLCIFSFHSWIITTPGTARIHLHMLHWCTIQINWENFIKLSGINPNPMFFQIRRDQFKLQGKKHVIGFKIS
jgi:hypothetical protein